MIIVINNYNIKSGNLFRHVFTLTKQEQTVHLKVEGTHPNSTLDTWTERT